MNLTSLIPDALRSWFAFGGGVGIEVSGPAGAESLRITAVRVRPNGARVLDSITVEDAQHHAAGVWGTLYSSFLRKHGLGHVAAAVLLPRRDVTVRVLSLPGVSDSDLPSAIEFQMDGLHPYPEADAVSGWARLPGTASVLVAITRRSVVERFTTLFAEAGIKVGTFTSSAAAIVSALRLYSTSASLAPVLAFESTAEGVEVYGESAARPLFFAAFDVQVDRALALAAAELRLGPETAAQSLHELLGAAPALPYAAALASACPALALPLNLLPSELRQNSSRALWIPSAALGAAVLLLTAALGLFPGFETRRYLKTLDAEIAKVAPAANRSAALDRQIAAARARTMLLDQVRASSKANMDVLSDLTHTLPPPTWLNLLEITRTQVNVAGETPQAAPLLQQIDNSPLFEKSEFSSPPMRVPNGEVFRLRIQREAGK